MDKPKHSAAKGGGATHTKPKRAPKPRIGSTRTGRTMLIVLLGLAFCIIAFMIMLYPLVMVGSKKEATIIIPANATKETVRDSLERHLGSGFTAKVMTLARLRNVDFSKRHGLYTIPKGSNALSAMRKITSGAQTPVRITVNGFRSLPLLIDRISAKMEFPADSLRAVLSDPAFMIHYGLRPEQALALFVDDTYEVYWTSSARELVEKIAENYQYLWNMGNTRAAADMGLTPADIMIIASITDEETNDEEEKGTIGRLYVNRLQNNMKLQADPTVRFAMGDFTIQRISRANLKTESPYNTYLHEGLPPGPIRTTSASTVKRILRSQPHSYLYMCAKEDFSGSHNFATSYDEHIKNATAYQSALNRRGITL